MIIYTNLFALVLLIYPHYDMKINKPPLQSMALLGKL